MVCCTLGGGGGPRGVGPKVAVQPGNAVCPSRLLPEMGITSLDHAERWVSRFGISLASCSQSSNRCPSKNGWKVLAGAPLLMPHSIPTSLCASAIAVPGPVHIAQFGSRQLEQREQRGSLWRGCTGL